MDSNLKILERDAQIKDLLSQSIILNPISIESKELLEDLQTFHGPKILEEDKNINLIKETVFFLNLLRILG